MVPLIIEQFVSCNRSQCDDGDDKNSILAINPSLVVIPILVVTLTLGITQALAITLISKLGEHENMTKANYKRSHDYGVVALKHIFPRT